MQDINIKFNSRHFTGFIFQYPNRSGVTHIIFIAYVNCDTSVTDWKVRVRFSIGLLKFSSSPKYPSSGVHVASLFLNLLHFFFSNTWTDYAQLCRNFVWSVTKYFTGLCWMNLSSTTRVPALVLSQCTLRTQTPWWLQYGGCTITRGQSGDTPKPWFQKLRSIWYDFL